MRHISTSGIFSLDPVRGAPGVYYCTDAFNGDLYEAEELYRGGETFHPNRLLFVTYPEGRVTEPVKAGEGQYFGDPLGIDGEVYLLLTDFPAGEIRVLRLDKSLEEARLYAVIPLSKAEDCYNLSLGAAPLMLTRASGDVFQILWPERREFPLGPREAFILREGEELFFNNWDEDNVGGRYSYREETVVRDMSGRELRRLEGAVQVMPNGEKWLVG